MSELTSIFDATLVHSTLRFAAPLLLAALGGLLCERAGVFNIALEGLMLIGAFAAVVGSYQAGSLAGVVAAMLAGALMAALFAVFSLGLKADEIVVGIALNLLAAGLTVFLLRAMFDVKGAFQDPRIEGLSTLDLPTGLIEELSQHPNIVGIKDSRGKLDLVGELVEHSADDLRKQATASP